MDQEKRQRIINTAMHMFNENGFHNTPTSKIAKQAGVSVGTLFNYFPTKEDLIESIYVSVKIHSKEYFLSNLDESKSDYELIKEMWRSVIKWGMDNPDEFHFLGLFKSSPFKNMQKDPSLAEQYTKLKERLQSILKIESICAKNTEFTLRYFNSVIRVTTEFLLTHELDNELEFIDSAFDLFWNGYARR